MMLTLLNSTRSTGCADDLKFLREEADNYYGEMQQQHQMALQKQAQEAVKVLSAGHS